MNVDKTWGKVNPHHAKIMALTTKLEQLEKICIIDTKPNHNINTLDSGGNKIHFANLCRDGL